MNKSNLNKSPPKGDSISSKNKNNSKHSKAENKEIIYAMPARPLDFSFKEVKFLEDLRKMEARSGIRRSVEEIIKEDQDKTEQSNPKIEKNVNTQNNNYDDEYSERFEKKPKKEQRQSEINDLVEGRIFAEKMVENKGGKIVKKDEERTEVSKKKVKYAQYTNSLILHSNQIASLKNIHYVLNEILPEVDIISMSNRNKIDLIQWIDLSHNRLEELHSDILNLPYLKILYCHANFIKEIESVNILSNCKSLLNLTLHGNPIEQIKGYRHFIIELCPSIEKLDFTLVSEKELDIIHHRGSRYGEKRNKQGTVIEFPKLDDEILKRMRVKIDVVEKKDDI